MMSLETIRQLAADAGKEAREGGILPVPFWEDVIKAVKLQLKNGESPEALRLIPFIGDHVPDGFELVEEHFVDSTGWGHEDEPALTIGQFAEKLRNGRFYAITQSGQFQIFIGEFRKVGAS